MSLPIQWSPRAKEEFATILSFLDVNHGGDVAYDCLERVESAVSLIAQFPSLYPISDFEGVRRAVIHPYISVFYSIGYNFIEILKIWDNRQDPEILEFP
jgi:plasmid stabilization system protein ParE